MTIETTKPNYTDEQIRPMFDLQEVYERELKGRIGELLEICRAHNIPFVTIVCERTDKDGSDFRASGNIPGDRAPAVMHLIRKLVMDANLAEATLSMLGMIGALDDEQPEQQVQH